MLRSRPVPDTLMTLVLSPATVASRCSDSFWLWRVGNKENDC